MTIVTTTCPYCYASHTSFQVSNLKWSRSPGMGDKPYNTTHEATGECGACGSFIALFFCTDVDRGFSTNAEFINELNITNCKTNSGDSIRLIGQLPKSPKPAAPIHTPESVARAFIDGEKARQAGAFSAAVGQYRKTIERAILPFVEEEFRSKMLGTKLGNLEKNDLLPKPMLDWIRVVKNDGNFAMHDDDRDFETNESVMPAREFTLTLIRYLYTLPEQVKLAQGLQSKRDVSSQ